MPAQVPIGVGFGMEIPGVVCADSSKTKGCPRQLRRDLLRAVEMDISIQKEQGGLHLPPRMSFPVQTAHFRASSSKTDSSNVKAAVDSSIPVAVLKVPQLPTDVAVSFASEHFLSSSPVPVRCSCSIWQT